MLQAPRNSPVLNADGVLFSDRRHIYIRLCRDVLVTTSR